MSQRLTLQPVFVLHSRPYSNTSLIVELFSKVYGRIAVVAKSARGPSSRFRGQLQLFTPILASWLGAHELKTLTQIELNGMPLQLNQKPLFCGFYLNELLMRLLYKEDPHPKLFDYYHDALNRLEKNNLIPATLRLFEKKLLDELGYGLPFTVEAKTRTKIQADLFYRFEHHHGFFLCSPSEPAHTLFLGNDLLAIAEEKFDTDSILQSAKRLFRSSLIYLLGNKPLNSRGLF